MLNKKMDKSRQYTVPSQELLNISNIFTITYTVPLVFGTKRKGLLGVTHFCKKSKKYFFRLSGFSFILLQAKRKSVREFRTNPVVY